MDDIITIAALIFAWHWASKVNAGAAEMAQRGLTTRHWYSFIYYLSSAAILASGTGVILMALR